MGNVIYVDNNATTRVAPEVLDAMKPFLTSEYGNPSSMHSFGGNVRKHVENAREKVARLIGAETPEEVIFTGCGTESDNAAIMGTLRADNSRKHIVTTEVEHPAVLNLCQYLEESEGCRITYLQVNEKGGLDLDELKAAIDENTALITIMRANNETGVLFPVERIAEIASEKGIPFHTDAVQAVGKVPIDISSEAADMLSLSGHKIHAPKGIGALYLRRGTRFVPWMIGGHQEKGQRGGTENVASIVGLGKACELALEHMEEESTRIRGLRDKLENGLLEKVENAQVNGDRATRLPNTSNIGFEFVEGEAILLMMDQFGIAASSGSACTSGSLSPSHVLRAMGVPFTFIQGSIRFSLSRYNTEKDIDRILEVFPGIINRLREISPYGQHLANINE